MLRDRYNGTILHSCVFLFSAGGTLGGRKRGGDATRRWRNNKIADYLRVPYGSDQQLAQDLTSRFGSLSLSGCLSIVKERTGITQYYTAYHPATLKFIKRHSIQIALAFRQVSIRSVDVYDKIRTVATLIESHGDISAAGHHISPFNGLTPVLSCLDPQCRFPIMNVRTRNLLRSIGMKAAVGFRTYGFGLVTGIGTCKCRVPSFRSTASVCSAGFAASSRSTTFTTSSSKIARRRPSGLRSNS